MNKDKKILNYFIFWLFLGFITCIVGISDVFALGGTNLNHTIQHYFVRTMSYNDPTQVGSYEYTTNPFLTSNISENGWLPRLIGFDGVASSNFNSSYVYTLTYRFNYPSSTDVFDWKTYINYASFKVYGSTPDLFSCSIITNTSSYTDVKCTFKRNKSDNYFFFYFDFYDNYNATHTYGIPYNFGTFQLSFSNISLTYTQDTGQIQVEQNNIIINQNNETNKKLDEQNKTSKGIFEKLKDLFNWLTNKDDADVSSAGNVAGWLPPGPLDSLINLPLTMLTNINSSLNKTCSPLEVNLPYVNKTVEIPCLNTIFNQITGLNSFWTWVGMIGSVLILYRYLINLYNYYDKLTDLQANFISDWGSV